MSSTEFDSLEQRLNAHQEKLNTHIEQCDAQFAEGTLQFLQLMEQSRATTEAVQTMVQQSAAVIRTYNDFSGAIRIGISAQKFGLWLIKWPLVGAGLYAAYKWFIDYISSGN